VHSHSNTVSLFSSFHSLCNPFFLKISDPFTLIPLPRFSISNYFPPPAMRFPSSSSRSKSFLFPTASLLSNLPAFFPMHPSASTPSVKRKSGVVPFVLTLSPTKCDRSNASPPLFFPPYLFLLLVVFCLFLYVSLFFLLFQLCSFLAY